MLSFLETLAPANNQDPAAKGGSNSLLNQWNEYSVEKDVESGSAETYVSGLLSNTIEGAEGTFKGLLSSGSNSFSSIQKSVNSSVGLPSQKQWMYFIGLFSAGIFFLSLAFFVMLPMLVIAPAKFATSFTFGCMCMMGSFVALRGWKQQLMHMISKERIPFTSVYALSIVGTLYASLMMHSYLLSIVFSVVQVTALLYYVSSYFPGGSAGMKMMLSVVGQGFYSVFRFIVAAFQK